MKRLTYSILVTIIIGSCTKNEPFSEDGENRLTAVTASNSCNSILLVPLDLIDYKTDPFEIKEVSIRSHELVFSMECGGGCGEADFSLLVNKIFMKSYPAQAQIIVALKDNDACEALITREVCFDLTELSELYKSNFQTSHGSISIPVYGHPSVLYTF